jgi:hypothetical protein
MSDLSLRELSLPQPVGSAGTLVAHDALRVEWLAMREWRACRGV